MNIEIANRLVELRKKNGLSQEELADKLGLSRQAVSKWERAESSPDTDNLICLAKLYNVSLDDLLNTDQSIEEISNEVKEKNNEEKNDNCCVKKEKHAPLSEKDKKRAKVFDVIDAITTGTLFFIATIIYFLVSFYHEEQWGKLWCIFLAPIVISSLFSAIKNRRFSNFAYPVFVTLVYFILGVYADAWHPGWIIFITIPIFYSICKPIDRAIASKRGEPVDIEEDDEDEEDD